MMKLMGWRTLVIIYITVAGWALLSDICIATIGRFPYWPFGGLLTNPAVIAESILLFITGYIVWGSTYESRKAELTTKLYMLSLFVVTVIGDILLNEFFFGVRAAKIAAVLLIIISIAFVVGALLGGIVKSKSSMKK